MAIGFERMKYVYGHLEYLNRCSVKGCFNEGQFCLYSEESKEIICPEHLAKRLSGTSADDKALLVEAIMTCLEKIQALERWKEG